MSCFAKQSTADYTALIAEGEFPESFDELTDCGRSVSRANARAVQTLAMIAAAGKKHFGAKLSEWVNWCREELNVADASYRCHLVQIGEMLHGLRNADCFAKQYKQAFALPADKLLAIARLPQDQIAPFLSHHPELDTMERAAVRAAVAEWLGEEPAPVATLQPLLPGFDEALDAIVAFDEGKLYEAAASPRFNAETALKMSYSGVTLCKASVGFLADHADELDDDMLTELTEGVELIHNRLAAAVASRRRKLLNN